MSLSAEQLLSIARSYWRPDRVYQHRAENSPETQRLHALWEQELKKLDQWWAFLDALERELPGFTLGDATATCDASFRCVAYQKRDPTLPRFRWAVVGCVSILAPVSTVYGVQLEYDGSRRIGGKAFLDLLPSDIREVADLIGRRIEASFGVSVLPRDIAQTPIPLRVDWQEPPHTTLFHALFSSEPERVP